MKKLILYATKYGATAEIARRIAEKLGDANTHDLKNPIPDLAEYDCIIIGSSIYAGAFRKEVKSFFAQNEGELLQKKLGLFASGMSRGDGDKVFAENVPDKIKQTIKATALLGGIFDPTKANFMERFIMKIVTKQSGHVERIDDSKIENFVREMQG
ncbi:MAG: flavodoxin domain-containing protein [Oscillospiraceae bacterium]|nr:flavodoxin domain-containing protein [Oscillospiraceae bacterium]